MTLTAACNVSIVGRESNKPTRNETSWEKATKKRYAVKFLKGRTAKTVPTISRRSPFPSLAAKKADKSLKPTGHPGANAGVQVAFKQVEVLGAGILDSGFHRNDDGMLVRRSQLILTCFRSGRPKFQRTQQ